jgi:undecaprenyl-diphosphatase
MFFQAIIIGLVQGLTEFLPISSSAHIRVVSELIGAKDWGAHFTAICQIGTELAVLIYFRKDIKKILVNWFKCLVKGKTLKERLGGDNFDAKMGWYIIVGSIPVVVLGVLFKHAIEGPLRNLFLTAFMLIFFGLILGFVDQKFSERKSLKDLDTKTGILFGLGQALSLIPGVSRSGGTISVGRALTFDRESTARYSFLLAIPAVFGSGLFELVDVIKEVPANFPGIGETITATIVAFVVGYISIIAFLKIVSTHSYRGFVIYRVGLGVLLFLMLLTGILQPI